MPEETNHPVAAPEQIVVDNTPLDTALKINKRRKFVQNIVNSTGVKLVATAFLLVALFSSTFVVAYNKVQEQQAKAALNQIPKAQVILPPTIETANNPTETPAQSEVSQFCGGIAGIACQEGYQCKLDGTYPDAGGTCIPL